MTPDWLAGLLKALFATALIEECVALFWRERSRRLALTVLIANLVTSPLLNLIIFFAPDSWLATDCRYYSLVGVLEGVVLLSESWLFYTHGRVFPAWRAILFSLSLNATSYFSAYPLEKLGYWG